MSTWDADLYYRFRAQRTQPSIDLTARIELEQPQHVVDLGCGPGNSTAVLRHRWPDANLVGVDNSQEMLDSGRKSDASVEWVLADIAAWQPARTFDVVFSNAALQWLPGHDDLIPRLFGFVREGGVLAVQMPDHYDSPLYRVLSGVADHDRWSARMTKARHSLTRHPVGYYYDLLCGLTDRIEIWTTEYQHVLSSHEEILQWHRGTGMRPYLDILSEEEREAFEKLVLQGYQRSFPRTADGNVLFPFQRLFFIAARSTR